MVHACPDDDLTGAPAQDFRQSVEPIGIMESPYKEKFGVPRQPRLAAAVVSRIRMLKPYSDPAAFRGIEGFSHLWLIFGFSLVGQREFRPMVRPPRLGGNARIGVFASRSPFRPNSLGLSAVGFAGIERVGTETFVKVTGADLVDGTPVYDIKPYIAFTDSIENADSSFASLEPVRMRVEFSEEAESFMAGLDEKKYPYLRELLSDILSNDARPAYKAKLDDAGAEYGVRLYDFDVRFAIFEGSVRVLRLELA